jgi:dihydrofolate synthase/folylpolyglutamate synthase
MKMCRVQSQIMQSGWILACVCAPLSGKGSTVAVVASVLRCAGYRVGVYTSPHLHHISERMSTEAGSHIRPEAFDELVSDGGLFVDKT